MSKKSKEQIEREYKDACNEAAQSIAHMPGDRGFNRIDRRMTAAGGIRRNGRITGGTSEVDAAFSFLLYGLQNFSAANYLQTATPGGEPGFAAGFVVPILFRIDKLDGTTSILYEALSTGPNCGWGFTFASNALSVNVFDGGNLNRTANSRTFVASDVGRIFCALLHWSGTALSLFVDRVLYGASLAVTGMAPATPAPTSFGARKAGAVPAAPATLLAGATFHGAPSTAQAQAYLDAARVLGDLPDTMQGATAAHLWSVKRELAGTVVVNGQTGPAQLTDRITAASGDALARVGVVAVQTDSNAIRAVGPYGTSDAYQSVAGGGLLGSASGFHVVVDLWLYKTPGAAEIVAQCQPGGGTQGWAIQIVSGTTLRHLVNGAVGGGYAITGADVGRRTRVLFQYTGTVARMYVNSATQSGADQTVTYIVPTNQLFQIGQYLSTQVFASGYVEAVEGGNTVLTGGEIATLMADFTVSAPAIAGKTQRRWILEQDIAAASGALPLTLVDRLGNSEALTLAGGPVRVKTIDPTIDGRRTLGAQGFSAANYLQCVNGLAGALTGHWISWFGVINSTPSALGVLVGRRNSAVAQSGFELAVNGTTIYFEQVNTGASAIPNTNTPLTTAMIGQPKVITGVFTGTTGGIQNVLQLYVDGVQLGGNVTCVGLTVAPVPFRVGILGDGTVIANTSSWFGDAGGLGVPTAQQVADHASATLAAGRMQSIAGLTSILHDATTDILASGVDAIPTQVLDRVATTCIVQTDANSIRSIGPYSAGDSWQTALGGGIQGVAGGFHVVIDVWLTQVPSLEMFIMCTPAAANQGWYMNSSAGGRVSFVGAPSTVTPTPFGYLITASDLNKRLRFLLHRTAAGNIQLWLNGVQVGADVAATWVPNSTAVSMIVGQYYGAQNLKSGYVEAVTGGNTALTSGEITSVFADLTTAPPTIVGKTQKRWVFEQDIAANGGVRPVASIERISGGDDLVRYGSDLQRVGIDVHMNANAIRGVGPYGVADGFQSAPGGGLPGSVSGFHIAVDIWLTKLPTTPEMVVSNQNNASTQGVAVQFTGAGGLRILVAGLVGASYTLSGADIGRRTRVLLQYTGTAGQLYVSSATQVGVDKVATYIVPTNQLFQIGQYLSTQGFGSGYVEAVEGGNTVLTGGEIATLMADLTTTLPVIAGKTLKRWIFETDIAAVSGALPARSAERISGGDDLVRIGAPLTLAQRTERLWSYETAPIYRDLASFTLSDYYSVAGGFAGDPAGFGFVVPVTITSQTVTSASRVLVSKRDATTPGFQLTTSSQNNLMQFTVGSSTNSTVTSNATINASDVGKRLYVICWFDGSKAHIYLKRAESGTGSTVLTGNYAPSTAAFVIGKRGDNTLPADGLTIGGFIGLVGVPSIAECHAIHDALQAREQVVAVTGRESFLYDPTQDAAGSSTPISVLTERIAGTQNISNTGSPTQAQVYARAGGV